MIKYTCTYVWGGREVGMGSKVRQSGEGEGSKGVRKNEEIVEYEGER